MAKNALPNNIGDLVKLANKMVSGLSLLGPALGLTQITAGTLQGQLNAFAAAQTDFNTSRKAKEDASALSTQYHAQIEAWLLKAREVLVPILGRSWSAAWAEAGFVDRSTAVPTAVGEQLNLIGLLAAFFTANPSYENGSLEVTAATATALRVGSVTADGALDALKTAAAAKKAARDAALETLRGSMRMLVRILDELLAADDPRWTTFGLNLPDADTTPAAPEHVTASLAEGTLILAACAAVPLATRYRWRMRRVGIDPDFVLAASTKSPLAQIDHALPGQTVELMVQAANESAQSLPSASVFITLPPVAERMAAVKAAAGGSGEAPSGYTALQAASPDGSGAEEHGAARGGRSREANGARH